MHQLHRKYHPLPASHSIGHSVVHPFQGDQHWLKYWLKYWHVPIEPGHQTDFGAQSAKILHIWSLIHHNFRCFVMQVYSART